MGSAPGGKWTLPAGPVVPDPPGSARIRPFHCSAPATLNPLRLLHLEAVYFMDLSPHRFLRAVPHVVAAFPGFLLLFLGGASGMGRGAAQLLWLECAPSDYPGPGRAGGRPRQSVRRREEEFTAGGVACAEFVGCSLWQACSSLLPSRAS